MATTYMCIQEIPANSVDGRIQYASDYKSIMLSDNPQIIQDFIDAYHRFTDGNAKFSDIVECSGTIDEVKGDIIPKLNARYIIESQGFKYQGPEENNIYRILVRMGTKGQL